MHRTVKVGLYGENGHQIYQAENLPGVQIVGAAKIAPEKLPESIRDRVRYYDSLDELLAGDCEVVSLCSPYRRDQAFDAVRCLEAGKHAYGEKPSAFTESELDLILATSARTGKIYHEMAGTLLEAPYAGVRRLVQEGVIGKVIDVHSQKAYPWFDSRPADEDIDGGLMRQVGIYNMRFTEFIAGVKIASVTARETLLGNPVPGSRCRRAAVFAMTLENGGVASGNASYLGPRQPEWTRWGYEYVRIFGEKGFIECLNLGETVRLFLHQGGVRELDLSGEHTDYFGAFVEEIATGRKVIPLELADELSPTRWVIRAKRSVTA